MDVVTFLLHISLFLLSMSSRIPKVASQATLAKPDCQPNCSNIEIPYPFGIGPGCYMNEWFQISCDVDKSTGRPTPRLNPSNLNLEVLDISLQGATSLIRNPITFFSDCAIDKPVARQAPNLTDSPFVFSPKNRFVSMSCGGIALMKLINGSIIGGCLAICDNKGGELQPLGRPDICNGINCCQTPIPANLTTFNTSFQVVNDATLGTVNCKYAFLADEEWFSPDSFTEISTLQYMEYVPAVLQWNLSQYSKFDVYGTDNLDDPNSSMVCTSSNNCSCSNGFEGNPYIVHGCQDIDECKEPNKCGLNNFCTNYPGGFQCSGPDPKPLRSNLAVIVTSCVLGVLFIHIGAWWSHKTIKKRNNMKRKQRFFKQNGGLLLEQQLSSGEVNVEKIKLFNAGELEKATDHFSVDRILGQGGQGTVYKGMLANGRIVAVKKSKNIVSGDEVRQFINEIVILSQIIHRNVVKLLGCCLETEVPLLVYEFIHNGTLSHYIKHQNEDFPLTWEMRVRVATEVAGALSYLHSAASSPIYHRDIKSSNILLDDKFRAKVADFGTSRSVAIDKTHLTMSQINGTFGYLDPEYFQSSQFTDKSDVYSYGVVLVELLTGQKPIFKTKSQESISLAHYFLHSMEENRLFDILDARVVKDGGKEEIMVVANLATRCLNLNGKKRPTMKEVAVELEGIQLQVKDFDVQANYKDVGCVQTGITEAWDVGSTSTHESSMFSGPSGTGSPFDVEPLLFINTQ